MLSAPRLNSLLIPCSCACPSRKPAIHAPFRKREKKFPVNFPVTREFGFWPSNCLTAVGRKWVANEIIAECRPYPPYVRRSRRLEVAAWCESFRQSQRSGMSLPQSKCRVLTSFACRKRHSKINIAPLALLTDKQLEPVARRTELIADKLAASGRQRCHQIVGNL